MFNRILGKSFVLFITPKVNKLIEKVKYILNRYNKIKNEEMFSSIDNKIIYSLVCHKNVLYFEKNYVFLDHTNKKGNLCIHI